MSTDLRFRLLQAEVWARIAELFRMDEARATAAEYRRRQATTVEELEALLDELRRIPISKPGKLPEWPVRPKQLSDQEREALLQVHREAWALVERLRKSDPHLAERFAIRLNRSDWSDWPVILAALREAYTETPPL